MTSGLWLLLGLLMGWWLGRQGAKTLFVACLIVGPVAAGPIEAVATARIDLERLKNTLPDEEYRKQSRNIRYLTTYHIPEKYQANWELLQRFHIHSLSREADLSEHPKLVAPGLYRLDLSLYGIDPDVYEKLRDGPEPYFHAKIERDSIVEVEAEREFIEVKVRGKTVRRPQPGTIKKRIKKKETVLASASWLPKEDIAFLIQETGSEVPVLRADWFWIQTVVQEERVAGYYDFLKIKNRADFERLVGVDVTRARERKKATASIVKKSGVAQHNRQIFRFGAIDSGAWRTLDVFDTETGRRNAIRNVNDDFLHDAEEHYGFLPNGLFAYFLCDKDGNPQKTAPDKIGPDKTSTSNDGRIHAYLSCVRCHSEGLRPIDDYARKFYQGPIAFGSPDFVRAKQFREEYLSDLNRKLTGDRSEFEHSLARVTGWKPAELSAAYREWWEWLHDRTVTLDRAAAEVGCKPADLRLALTRQGLPPPLGVGVLDPIFSPFAVEQPSGINREQFDESFQKLMLIVRGNAQ